MEWYDKLPEAQRNLLKWVSFLWTEIHKEIKILF
jgi:hypothetical protein